MDKEKFCQRVEYMIYNVCGCDTQETEILLKELLKRNKARKFYKEEKEKYAKNPKLRQRLE